MVKMMGMGPVFDGMGLINTIYSYGDDIAISFTSDRNMMPDPANYAAAIRMAFEELRDADDRANALRVLNARSLPYLSSETMHITPQWPFPAESVNDIQGIFFRVKLEDISGRYERNTLVNDVNFAF